MQAYVNFAGGIKMSGSENVQSNVKCGNGCIFCSCGDVQLFGTLLDICVQVYDHLRVSQQTLRASPCTAHCAPLSTAHSMRAPFTLSRTRQPAKGYVVTNVVGLSSCCRMRGLCFNRVANRVTACINCVIIATFCGNYCHSIVSSCVPPIYNHHMRAICLQPPHACYLSATIICVLFVYTHHTRAICLHPALSTCTTAYTHHCLHAPLSACTTAYHWLPLLTRTTVCTHTAYTHHCLPLLTPTNVYHCMCQPAISPQVAGYPNQADALSGKGYLGPLVHDALMQAYDDMAPYRQFAQGLRVRLPLVYVRTATQYLCRPQNLSSHLAVDPTTMCGPTSTVKTLPDALGTCQKDLPEFRLFHQSIHNATVSQPANRAAMLAMGSPAAAPMITDLSGYFAEGSTAPAPAP